MARGTVDLEIAVKAAVVNPGDTLILVTAARTMQELDDIEKQVKGRLPGVQVACLGGIDQALVYKPDPDAPAGLRPPTRPNPSDPIPRGESEPVR